MWQMLNTNFQKKSKDRQTDNTDPKWRKFNMTKNFPFTVKSFF